MEIKKRLKLLNSQHQQGLSVAQRLTKEFFLKKLLHDGPARLFTIVSVISLISFGIFLWVLLSEQKEQHSLSLDTYSNSLAEISSYQIRVLMTENNRIGLQSVLNDLVNQKSIVNGVIYTVDNEIIVQAGEINSELSKELKNVTVPITLDTSVLGSLTLTIDAQSSDMSTTVYLLFFSILAIVITGFLLLYRKGAEISPAALTVQNDIGTETTQATYIEETSALLVISISSLNKINQQLNADARKKQFDQLQSSLNKILTLYSGCQTATTSDSIIVRFKNTDSSQCFSNALYSAHLLQEVNKAKQSLLKLCCIVFDLKDNENTCDTLLQTKQVIGQNKDQLFITKEIYQESNLIEKIIADDSENYSTLIKIVGLSSKCTQLLANQLKHLL
jgi:uncharacterized membrane protein affecting hemolysin expression